MHRVKNLGGPGIPKNMGLGQGKCLSSGPHILECSSWAHKLTHSKAHKAQAESNGFQGFFLCIWKSFVLSTRKACYHRPPLIFGPKTEGYKHQIGAGPPRSGVSLPLSGNQFKVFFLCIGKHLPHMDNSFISWRTLSLITCKPSTIHIENLLCLMLRKATSMGVP
jgi:hypothetical protein